MWVAALYRSALCRCISIFVATLLTYASVLSEPSSHAYGIAEKQFQNFACARNGVTALELPRPDKR